MKFYEFVKTDAIVPELSAVDKTGVIQELLSALVAAGHVDRSEESYLFDALVKREELGSTGIGEGVAIPHTKHPQLDDMVGTVGVSHEGIDFEAFDRQPAFVFFLLISPTPRTTDHLRALECISHLVREPFIRTQLQNATTRKEIETILNASDGSEPTGSVFAARG